MSKTDIEKRLNKILDTLLSLEDDVNYIEKYISLLQNGNINAAAQLLMKADYSNYIMSDYMVLYHEDRLYSVRDVKNGIVILVYAGSEKAAINKIMKIGREKK